MTGWVFWIVVLIAVVGLVSSVPEMYGRWKARRDAEERARKERHEARRLKRQKKLEAQNPGEWEQKEREERVHWEDRDRY